jgi:hypothetical protein
LVPGTTLPTEETSEPVDTGIVGNGTVGKGKKLPVPEILMLGMVRLEFHPVNVESVGRVPLPEGLDVDFPGIGLGSEPLVVPDLVIPDSRVFDRWDVTSILDWRVWDWLPDPVNGEVGCIPEV